MKTKDDVTCVYIEIHIERETDECTNTRNQSEGDEGLRSMKPTGLHAALSACLSLYDCKFASRCRNCWAAHSGHGFLSEVCLRRCVRKPWHCLCLSPQLSVPWAPTCDSITESDLTGHLQVRV